MNQNWAEWCASRNKAAGAALVILPDTQRFITRLLCDFLSGHPRHLAASPEQSSIISTSQPPLFLTPQNLPEPVGLGSFLTGRFCIQWRRTAQCTYSSNMLPIISRAVNRRLQTCRWSQGRHLFTNARRQTAKGWQRDATARRYSLMERSDLFCLQVSQSLIWKPH